MKKIIILLFLFLSALSTGAQSLDFKILDKINTPFNEPADKNWKTFSNMNTAVCITAPVGLFVAGQIRHDKQMISNAYKLAASIVIAEAITATMKSTIRRDRPFVTYPDDIYRKTTGSGYSFPSGHASTSFALATSLSMSYPKWYVIVPSYAYACSISYSRMYLGVHYPSDVAAGMIIGAGSSYLSYKLNAWLAGKKHKKDQHAQ